MIIGIGTDIIEIKRIEKAIEKESFLQRIFTQSERNYIEKMGVQSAAGYFSAKEAVSKALGTGISGFNWTDIEIIKINGVPCVNLSNGALEISKEKGIEKIHVSISHSKEYAIAMAVAEG